MYRIRCAEVCGVSTFEVEGNQLRRGYGVVRTDYDIASESALADIVKSSACLDSGTGEFHAAFMNQVRRWRVEWRRVGSANRRILVRRRLLD